MSERICMGKDIVFCVNVILTLPDPFLLFQGTICMAPVQCMSLTKSLN